eukprot:10015557-Lingulodinium_polyedra.AAC.1
MRAPENWRARGARECATSEPLRPRTVDSTASSCAVSKIVHNDAVQSTVDSTASLCSVKKTVHNDTVEATFCRHSGVQIARAPCEHQNA